MRLKSQIDAELQAGTLNRETLVLVGIHTGGYWIAEKLHADLGFSQPLYSLSVTLQRDDFSRLGLHKQTATSRLPLTIQDAHVLLVDDVLHTGRTVRAALNELFEYGRPASVKLAVLADRCERELPIDSDFCGGKLLLMPYQKISLHQLPSSEDIPYGLEFYVDGKQSIQFIEIDALDNLDNLDNS
jgi:pyrimidine operon attenuation protein / uracil phosphoribosyltransferase